MADAGSSMWLPLALGAMQGTQALGGALGGGAPGT